MDSTAGAGDDHGMAEATEPLLWATSVSPPDRLPIGDGELRRWRLEDLPALHQACVESRTHLLPFMPWAVHVTPDDPTNAETYLAGTVVKWADRTSFDYAIVDADGAIAGSCGLMGRIDPGALEIGYWVHVDRTRRGLATRAAAALTEAGLAIPDVARVEIHHDSANTASGRVPQRLGYVRLREQPADTATLGGTGVHVVWGMALDAWPSSAGAALLAGVRA
jgi:RimJ/RimL family protein N-acetyltransferase